jgi:hypothetical protein
MHHDPTPAFTNIGPLFRRPFVVPLPPFSFGCKQWLLDAQKPIFWGASDMNDVYIKLNIRTLSDRECFHHLTFGFGRSTRGQVLWLRPFTRRFFNFNFNFRIGSWIRCSISFDVGMSSSFWLGIHGCRCHDVMAVGFALAWYPQMQFPEPTTSQTVLVLHSLSSGVLPCFGSLLGLL